MLTSWRQAQRRNLGGGKRQCVRASGGGKGRRRLSIVERFLATHTWRDETRGKGFV